MKAGTLLKWVAPLLLLGLACQTAIAQDAAPSPSGDESFTVDGVQVTEVQCKVGVYDCNNDIFADYLKDEQPEDATCAPYNNHFKDPQQLKWVVGVGAVIAMVMAFGIGSNDAANSWGTSVGSGAISLRWGCFVGGIMEWAGALAIGYGVAKTIKGIADIEDPSCFACGYCDSAMSLYMIAMFSALFAAALFLLLASTTWMPVSTTHAIIGGGLGATWAATKWGCLNWTLGGLGGIVLSWVLSPLLSGIMAALAYFTTYYTIIIPKLGGSPRKNGLIGVPVLYAIQAYVMMFLILLKAPATKKKFELTQMALFSIPVGVAIGVAGGLFVYFYVRKKLPSLQPPASDEESGMKKGSEDSKSAGTIEMAAKEETEGHHAISSPQEALDSAKQLGQDSYRTMADVGEDDENMDENQKDAQFCFKYLLVFVAALESFAHGSNDTGNATGAMSAIVQTFQEGTTECNTPQTPVWMMAVAGFFVFLGVNTFGYRVIQTVGSSITKINFHRGWCVEFASTFTVIIASVINMPVSTTHCQVGAVVAVGLSAFGPKKVAWSLFGKIFLTWVMTLPFAGGIAAALTAALRPAIYDQR